MDQAELQSDRDTQLTKLGLKSDLDTKLSVAKWQELKGRYALSKEQLDISSQSIKAQEDAQKVQIEKLRAAYQLKKEQVDQLTIRAGVDGTLTQLGTSTTPLEAGMRVAPGTILGKIAQPNRLKATLKIPETQVKDVSIGQVASIDTRNGIIPGHVSRIDPAAVNGTVDVDVKLEGQAPGMRPDLSVDGTITIEKLTDVLFVGRPVIGQPDAKITLFKLDPDTKEAERVPVKLGRSSVNTIEIVGWSEGRRPGDSVGYVGAGCLQSHPLELDETGIYGERSKRFDQLGRCDEGFCHRRSGDACAGGHSSPPQEGRVSFDRRAVGLRQVDAAGDSRACSIRPATAAIF